MDKAEQRKQALQAMDFVVQSLQTAQWSLVSGYLEHPEIAGSIIAGSNRLFLNALHIYHGEDVAAEYARRMIEDMEPFAAKEADVDEENWFDSLTPPLLEKLG